MSGPSLYRIWIVIFVAVPAASVSASLVKAIPLGAMGDVCACARAAVTVMPAIKMKMNFVNDSDLMPRTSGIYSLLK